MARHHLLLFAVEAIGLFAVVLLGSRLIVCAPTRRNVQLAALICLNAACARLLAREEYAFWIPAAYQLDVGARVDSEYRLRRLIHERLQYRNFNALLHRYRIEEACALLADPAQRHLPILTIALTVGYNSINPFNRAFRELKGMTPSEFRARARTDS